MRKFFICMETMRKSMATLAVILFCAAATTALTACGGDDDDDNGSNQPTVKPTTAVLDLSVLQTPAFLNYFDMFVEYNEGGITKTDTLTSGKWSKQITINLPGAFTLKEFVKQKTGLDLSADTTRIDVYYPQKGHSGHYTLKDANGAVIKSGNIREEINIKTQSRRLSSVVDLVAKNNFNKSLVVAFDADGNVSETWQ